MSTMTDRSPSAVRRRRRPALAAFAFVNAASAWFGALGLSFGWIDFGDRLNDRLPFDSLVVAGLALAVVVALPLSVLTWCAWTGDRRTGHVAIIAGTALVGWIAVQVVVLQEASFFQPIYATVGLVLVLVGRRLVNRSRLAASSPRRAG